VRIVVRHRFQWPILLAIQLFPELTEREQEILALIARHLTNTEIAECASLDFLSS
jgi:DNA-binding NarL/FixJ family response regulator